MYFYLNIEPMAQSRPRISTANGYARAYEKADIKKWKMTVAEMVIKEMVSKGWNKFSQDTAIAFRCAFSIPFPHSFSKKKCANLNNKPHTQKPDLDNYVKALLDALTGICWGDDKQVSFISATKAWGKNAFVAIHIEEDTEPLIPNEF